MPLPWNLSVRSWGACGSQGTVVGALHATQQQQSTRVSDTVCSERKFGRECERPNKFFSLFSRTFGKRASAEPRAINLPSSVRTSTSFKFGLK
jgi:hypothetical protein